MVLNDHDQACSITLCGADVLECAADAANGDKDNDAAKSENVSNFMIKDCMIYIFFKVTNFFFTHKIFNDVAVKIY